jgi:hypothetical protein
MDNNDSLKNLYATAEDRMDTMLDRRHVGFWLMIRKAKPPGVGDPHLIAKYMLDEFGIKLTVTTNDFGALGYAPEAHIVDEQKYLLFLLKYQS